MTKNVMVRAWEIAKEGVAKFGGKVKEYFATALKLAWAETRTAEIVTTSGSRNHKSWVAVIVGPHAKFKLERKFLTEQDDEWADKTFVVKDGFYDVCNAGVRSYVQVSGGKVSTVSESVVIGAVA